MVYIDKTIPILHCPNVCMVKYNSTTYLHRYLLMIGQMLKIQISDWSDKMVNPSLIGQIYSTMFLIGQTHWTEVLN